MLDMMTSGVCPKCKKETLLYDEGKFVCTNCCRKYTSKEVEQTTGDLFEITTGITKQSFVESFNLLQSLANRFNANSLGYDPCGKGIGLLNIGWENGYPVRLNMMVQELNEILA